MSAREPPAPPAPAPERREGPLRRWLRERIAAPGFLARYPYYAAVLARFEPIADASVHSLAIELHDGRFYLHVNAPYFEAHPEFLTGILLHEVHHVVLGHLSDERLRALDDDDARELAMEMSANEHLDEPLPNPVRWQQFTALGMKPGQSTRERYELLRAHAQALPSPRPGPCDDHTPWSASAPEPGATQATRRLLEEALASAAPEAPLPPLASPLPKRLQLAGTHPGRLLETLTNTLRAPEAALAWPRALRELLRRVRAPVHTYARPNRRFPHRVGEVPGRHYAPTRVERPHLLVALDTSSSVRREQLEEAARHLAVLAREARLTVVECDTEVTRVYPFAGKLTHAAGRGGTDLRPVFARETLGALRPDAVVYFTDGQGPFEPNAPAVPVLWVLHSDEPFACPWGHRARLSPAGASPAVERAATKPAGRAQPRAPRARSGS